MDSLFNVSIETTCQILGDLEQAEKTLASLIRDEAKVKKQLADVGASIARMEAKILLKEENPEGAINGTNQPKRDRQMLLFLDELAKEDSEYGKLVEKREELQTMADEFAIGLKVTANYFSERKTTARLMTALLNSLE